MDERYEGAMYKRFQDRAMARIRDLEAERDALRRAVEAVRAWSLGDVPREIVGQSMGGYMRAKYDVRALLAAARIEAGR